MAQRRMFSLKIIDTDMFLDMPVSTQTLYFHLALRADDDGFISSPKRIMKIVNCSEDDMRVLTAKDYIKVFDSGVCVITHWRMHNYVQKDRYTPTIYQKELCTLLVVDNVYERVLDTKCIQDESSSLPQVRLGKVRLELNTNEHFEEIWKLYPKKRGKGRISNAKKKAMTKYSVEEWKDIIARYLADNLDPTYQQHGSTFFNGGYLDYTSENYSRDVKKISEVKAW